MDRLIVVQSMAASKQCEDLLDRSALPPLRIHHILVATFIAAVLLSVHEALRQDDAIGLSVFFRSGHGNAYTLTTALACTLVLFGFWWRRQGLTFFHQPGHWLLIGQSLPLGVFLFAAAGAMSRWTTGQVPYSLWMMWFLAMNLLAAAVSFRAAIRVADTIWWRLLFIVAGGTALLMAVAPFVGFYQMYIYGYWVGGFTTTVLLAAAAVSDRRLPRLRDWPHWSGVGLELILSAAAIAQAGWQWFAISK